MASFRSAPLAGQMARDTGARRTNGRGRRACSVGQVSVRGIYGQTLRTYWRQAGFLMLLGAVVFIPLSLLDALADKAQEIDTGEVTDFEFAALIAGLSAQGVTSLLGELFYSGAVAVTLADESRTRRSLREVSRRLSYGRLIAVDLLYAAVVAVGLDAFVIPGVVLFTAFALAGPVVELEEVSVMGAFARSWALVRGHFWQVLAVLVPITLVSAVLSVVLLATLPPILGSHFLSDWIGEAASSIALSPFYAVAAVLITLQLSRRVRGTAPV
jgi:hypothetical protein